MSETIPTPLANAVKRDSKLLVVLGVVTVILGMLALVSPFVAGLAVTLSVGILLMAGGVARTIFAFKCKSWGKGILAFVLGALTILCGLLMVTRPLLGLASLTLVLAAYFFVDGVVEIFEAFDLKPLRGWGWMLFGGLASIVLGFLIWRQWPLSGAWAIGVLVGIKLVFAGWAMVSLGASARSVVGAVDEGVASAAG